MKSVWWSLFFVLIFCLSGCADKDNAKQILGGTSQNIWDYIKSDQFQTRVIDKEQQQKASNDYLKHFFSPWTGQDLFDDNTTIKTHELSYIKQFEQNPGFGENHQPHSSRWIKNIQENMNLDAFASHPVKAIITEATDLRVLPTVDPAYAGLTQAGQFYPFDNLQASFVSVGTPALILQSTKDGAWDLILIHNAFGWVQHQHIAYADESFIHQWQDNAYGIVMSDHTPVAGSQKFAFSARLGSLYPIPKTGSSYVYIPLRTPQQQAIMVLGEIAPDKIHPFPLPFTLKNMGLLIQQLVGNPYGWGGMYGYRDCSATTQDLLASFGVWLPRNSGEQIKTSHFISLQDLNRMQKQAVIEKKGIPFLTLIGLPGHIMLYIGTYHHKPYFLQEVWGLRTGIPYMPFLGAGRAVIGQTVITPIDFDQGFINVPTPFIDKINGLTIL